MTDETAPLVSWFLMPKDGPSVQRPWLRRTLLGLLVAGLVVVIASLLADLVAGRIYLAVAETQTAGVLLLLGPRLFGRRPVSWLARTLGVVIVGSLVVGAWQAWTGG